MGNDAVKKILAANPKARRDEKVMREALSSVKSLRDMGIRPAGYALQSPFKKKNLAAARTHRYNVLTNS